MEDTTLDMLEPFTGGLKEDGASSSAPNAGCVPERVMLKERLGDKLPSVCHRCGRRYSAKSKKGIIGSHP